MQKEKTFSDGGKLTIDYTGEPWTGSIDFVASKNEGLDREMELTVKTTNGKASQKITVHQEGLRELLFDSNGEVIYATDSSLNVLKK